MEDEIKAVEIDAEIRQIKSMADHTFSIVLNVPEYCLPQMREMMGWLLSTARITVVKED